jgi:hypothetical protein
MQIKCPACYATFSLETAVALDAARAALSTALQMPAPLAGLLAQYLGMFRSAGRVLAFDRAERLMAELLPMLTEQRVERAGNSRSCPLAIWQQALERMVEHRAAGKLELPLKSHGYLLEIAFGLADKAEAAAEREAEERRRTGAHRSKPEPVQQSEAASRSELYHRAAADVRIGLLSPAQAVEKLRAAGLTVPDNAFQ